MKTPMKRSGLFPGMIDDFFRNELFSPAWTNQLNRQLPAVNISEDEDAFHVELAAPGLKREDFKINLDGHLLTIGAETKAQSETKEGNYSRREFNYSSFSRSFTLPEELVDAEKISARYENGVLNLSIPKKETAKPKGPRVIDIEG
jgi:HSP20 family protein